MVSKVIISKSFYAACKYICEDKKRAVILETEGVRSHSYKLMAKDFEMQHSSRPTLNKAVFHGILSFYPGEKIDDQKMVLIAKEYLEKMNITNTQYAITKHIDKDHSHLHIIANLVNDKGETIKDNWIGLRGKKIAQGLTLKYDLKQALSKDLSLTHLERLNEKEANRYIIYQAILERLSLCKSLDDLKNQLQKSGIETQYKYKGQTQELQGISFKIGEYQYKGSEIDRKFSLKNLERTIQQQQRVELKPVTITARINDLTEKLHETTNKELNQKNSLLEDLMKPEKMHEQTPYQLLKQRRKKKQSWRLH
jgi:hypothetical protein